MRPSRTLWPALLAVARAHLVVHSPDSLAATYRFVHAAFSLDSYNISATLVLAHTCPCEWPRPPIHRASDELAGRVLLLPGDIECPPGCTAERAACAASEFNISGMLFTLPPSLPPPATRDAAAAEAAPAPPPGAPASPSPAASPADDAAAPADDAATGTAGGCATRVPAAWIAANLSATFALHPNWTVTLLPVARSGEGVGNWSQVLETPPAALINVTMWRDDEDAPVDCTKYRSIPLVYVMTVPIWLALTLGWTWNTYFKNALHARDLHRLMCWVPITETVHGLLSLFNYYSCPWESVLSLVYATFWSIITILKEVRPQASRPLGGRAGRPVGGWLVGCPPCAHLPAVGA